MEIDNEFPKIKFISMDTWISDKDWYCYAKKKISEKEWYADRSPCRDPYYSNDKVYISGLCRGVTIANEKDYVVYYTDPCDEWIKDKAKEEVESDCLVLLKGMKVVKKYESHYQFYSNNNIKSTLPNIFKINKECNEDSNNAKKIFESIENCSYLKNEEISKYINPLGKSVSICWDFGKDDFSNPNSEEYTNLVYNRQIFYYYKKRFLEKKLKVLECENIPFKQNTHFKILKKDLFNVKIDENDLLVDDSCAVKLRSAAIHGRWFTRNDDEGYVAQGSFPIKYQVNVQTIVNEILSCFQVENIG